MSGNLPHYGESVHERNRRRDAEMAGGLYSQLPAVDARLQQARADISTVRDRMFARMQDEGISRHDYLLIEGWRDSLANVIVAIIRAEPSAPPSPTPERTTR